MNNRRPSPSRPIWLLSLLLGAALTTSCGGGGGGGDAQDQGGGGQVQTDAVWDQFDWDDANWS